jgi:hypothetical protein
MSGPRRPYVFFSDGLKFICAHHAQLKGDCTRQSLGQSVVHMTPELRATTPLPAEGGFDPSRHITPV